jgi:ribonuclease PH
MREDGRERDELREIFFETGYQPLPDGSVLIGWGETRVLCSACVENRVPPFLIGKKQGWVTAEYDMLPGSGNRRVRRDRGNVTKGRSQEIQRLIGRSLRQCLSLERLGERTVTVDCDVLVADGGTRMASVTGGAVALRLALKRMLVSGVLDMDPWEGFVAGTSLGVVGESIMLDLCYGEDSQAVLDMNVVADESGGIVEIQASAEQGTVDLATVGSMASMAVKAITGTVIPLQLSAVGD